MFLLLKTKTILLIMYMKSYSNAGTTGSTALSIGRLGSISTGYWYGYLKDARIYNRALTSTEITTLYNNGPNP